MRAGEMTLGDRIAAAARAKVDADVLVRERASTRRHRVVLRGGAIVDARMAGRFDPVLLELCRRGALTPEAYWAVLDALAASERRAGDLAVEIGGVAPAAVRDALRGQLEARVAALLALPGAEAWIERRPVAPREVVHPLDAVAAVRGSRRARDAMVAPARPLSTTPSRDLDLARRRLRQLARRLHPDLHPDLDPAARAALGARLAAATAAHHGI